MSEQQVEVPDVKQDTATTASEEKQPVNQVPYARFSGLVDEKNALKVELDTFRKDAKEQAESRKLKEMESKGEYEQIMANMTTKLEAAEKKANAFDEYNVKKRDSLLAELPEEDRAIYDGLSLEKLEKIVCNVEICENHPNWIWDYLDFIAPAIEFDAKMRVEENNILNKLPADLYTLTDRNIFIHNTAQIGKFVHLDASNGPIVIDQDCKISPFSSIVGPVYLGKRTSLKPSTSIRQSVVGRVCNLGGEVKGCIIHPYSNKSHDGFLGDSILGSWINLGAGTITSNMKNNYQPIRVSWDGNNYESGRQFLGSIIGDHVKTAIGVRLNTGTLIGPFCNVFQADFPPRAIPSFSWGNGTHELEKAIQTAELMLKRRSLALSKTQIKLITDLAEDHTHFVHF